MQWERKANRKGSIDGAHRLGSPSGLSQVQLRMSILNAIR